MKKRTSLFLIVGLIVFASLIPHASLKKLLSVPAYLLITILALLSQNQENLLGTRFLPVKLQLHMSKY